LSSPLDALSHDERALTRDGRPPKGSETMKAVLTDARFDDPEWIFERKLDGIRCLAVRDGDRVELWSRNDKSLNGRFPEIATALEREEAKRFAVDGEVVAFEGSQTSFARLARRHERPVKVFFYVFDVLWVDGADVRPLPLRARKKLLSTTLSFSDGVRRSNHRNGDGTAFFAEACRKGWEGLIAKRADSPYVSSRSKDWLKLKCDKGQELVVGGWTPPKGTRIELGALLMGYWDGDRFRYAGKVGTGFDRPLLRELAGKLKPLRREDPPFADAGDIKERGVTWVEPELVAEIGFTEWTGAGRLRHPRFLGLRDDKPARKVVREG
jgi:DNA ligase D-like protein (predicted ligase)